MCNPLAIGRDALVAELYEPVFIELWLPTSF